MKTYNKVMPGRNVDGQDRPDSQVHHDKHLEKTLYRRAEVKVEYQEPESDHATMAHCHIGHNFGKGQPA